jgi:hypothetical protein
LPVYQVGPMQYSPAKTLSSVAPLCMMFKNQRYLLDTPLRPTAREYLNDHLEYLLNNPS